MGTIRTLGATTVVPGTPTPAVLAAAYYTSSNLATPGVVIPAVSFSISKGIATVVINVTDAPGGVFPHSGYNGPNGSPIRNATTGSKLDIQGNWPAANGQQVTLWGFTTGTYFNGKRVTVLDCDPAAGSFRFYFNHADVGSTSDTGNTAPSPFQHYRAIRLECGQSNGSDFVYVGDLNVSSTQYMAALSLTGQLAIVIASENIPPEGIFIDGTTDTDSVQVSCIY